MLGGGVGEKSSSSRKSSMTKVSRLAAAVGERGGRRRGSVEVGATAADVEDESRASVSRSSDAAEAEAADGEGSAAIMFDSWG
jgi:hypothetical protein